MIKKIDIREKLLNTSDYERPLAAGIDSFVYLLDEEEEVIKYYKRLQEKEGLERTIAILKRYKQDTQQINWLLGRRLINIPRRLDVLGHEYFIDYEIIPQGLPEISEEGVIYTRQRYIEGPHLFRMLYSNEKRFSLEKNKCFKRFLAEVSKSLPILGNNPFYISSTNVKPLINGRTMNFRITDLGNHLGYTYKGD